MNISTKSITYNKLTKKMKKYPISFLEHKKTFNYKQTCF